MNQKKIVHNGTEYKLPKGFDYTLFSKEVMNHFINNEKYDTRNHKNVDDKIFQSFFNYITNKKNLPTITPDNIFGFRILCMEFGIEWSTIPGLNDENIYKLHLLQHISTDNCDKSDMEKYVAENLNDFLDNYTKELFELPLPSLWNIFNHKNCKFDHQKAYNIIIKQKEEKILSLLKFLDATKMAPEQVKTSIIEMDEHFGYIPFNISTYINSIFDKFNEIQLIEEAEKKCYELKEQIKGSEVTQIELPQYLMRIPNDIFEENDKITNIKIPESVVSIGGKAFSKCVSLLNFTIPKSVKYIGDMSFNGCIKLTELIIPESVTFIGDHAFEECTSLIKVTIPNSVKFIGDNAFHHCESLIKIELPSSLTMIRYSTFAQCSKLEEIIIPKSVKSIGPHSFDGCQSLKQIDLSGINSIGPCAFRSCSSLTRIDIHDGVEVIESNTFAYCSELVEVTIPKSVKTIKNEAFYKCSKLRTIESLSSVITIEYYAFGHCYLLEKVDIKSATSIGNAAFCYCKSLKEIDIPQGINKICNLCFGRCENLTTVKIPNSVVNIEDDAFSSCLSLEEIKFPVLEKFGQNVFWNYQKLKKILVPASMKDDLITQYKDIVVKY